MELADRLNKGHELMLRLTGARFDHGHGAQSARVERMTGGPSNRHERSLTYH